MQRRVHTYRDYINIDWLRQRIVELNAEHQMDGEIAAILNQEGFVAARGCAFKGENARIAGRPSVSQRPAMADRALRRTNRSAAQSVRRTKRSKKEAS